MNVHGMAVYRYDTGMVTPLSLPKMPCTTGFTFGRILVNATPSFVCDCIAYIRQFITTPGLFRVPGVAENIKLIRNAYDNFFDGFMDHLQNITVHDVCGALVIYLDTLPEPLVSFEVYNKLDKFYKTNKKEDGTYEVTDLVNLIKEVPSPRLQLLGMLLNFLSEVAQYEK